MDVRELAAALRAAQVDEGRYVLVPLLTEPWAWQLRPEGSVWLTHGRGHWSVAAGGIGPHYDVAGDLCTFPDADTACRTFLRELTGPGEPFAAAKARFSADCVREWWEDEVRIALDEPTVAADRVRWRETWRERELLGRELMTVGELEPAIVAAGAHRAAFQLHGIDETAAPREGATVVLDRDEQGRWFHGRWQSERPGLLLPTYRFMTEGEACQSLYQQCSGPITTTAPLTPAQWRLQPSVTADNQAAIRRYDEQLRARLEHEPPRTAAELPGHLHRRGIPADRYWVSGMTHQSPAPDAVCLVLDEATGEWHAEGRLHDGHRPVLRRFTSQTEAFRVFETELQRLDGAPFGAQA